jgi:hypothetical protein
LAAKEGAMTRFRLIGCSIAAGLAISGVAVAETAYTTRVTNLRAGPGRPVVQPHRHEERRRPEARPVERPAPVRPNRQHEEKKRGHGAD